MMAVASDPRFCVAMQSWNKMSGVTAKSGRWRSWEIIRGRTKESYQNARVHDLSY